MDDLRLTTEQAVCLDRDVRCWQRVKKMMDRPSIDEYINKLPRRLEFIREALK